MEIKSSVLDYLGKFEGGIMVLVALTTDENEYYEGVFFYNADSIVLSVDERLEQKLGGRVEEWNGYVPLLREILKNVVPYNQMINRIDEADFSPYLDYKDDESTDEVPVEIDPSQIVSATSSNI